jgi:hypothetical protein
MLRRRDLVSRHRRKRRGHQTRQIRVIERHPRERYDILVRVVVDLLSACAQTAVSLRVLGEAVRKGSTRKQADIPRLNKSSSLEYLSPS